MRSPVFLDTNLEPKEIEPGLSVFECPKSKGLWIPLQAYLDWRQANPQPAACARTVNAADPADDSSRPALLCPESGRVLLRYRVGHGLRFHVDQSPATGGMWLDAGEWEALKSKGLHSELNMICTESYQRQIRNEEHRAATEQSFRERIGTADFQKVAEFRNWMLEHPRRRDILQYITYDEDTHEGAKP
jgi:Zn-finger nucleic acid-binding protein